MQDDEDSMKLAIDDRFDFAQVIIREAGVLALRYFEKFESLDVTSKGVQDMASEAGFCRGKAD